MSADRGIPRSMIRARYRLVAVAAMALTASAYVPANSTAKPRCSMYSRSHSSDSGSSSTISTVLLEERLPLEATRDFCPVDPVRREPEVERRDPFARVVVDRDRAIERVLHDSSADIES